MALLLEVTDLEMSDLSPPKKPDPDAGKQKYEPTEREKTALDRYHAQKAAAPAAPRMKVTNGKKAATIAPDHPDVPLAYALLKEALGTVSDDFINGLLGQLANAGSHGRQIDEDALNFMLSVVTGIKPKDQLEAMLAAQMAAIHTATMTFARRLANVETIEQRDSAHLTNWRGPMPCKWRRSSATAPAASRRSRCSTYRSMRAGRRSSAT